MATSIQFNNGSTITSNYYITDAIRGSRYNTYVERIRGAMLNGLKIPEECWPDEYLPPKNNKAAKKYLSEDY